MTHKRLIYAITSILIAATFSACGGETAANPTREPASLGPADLGPGDPEAGLLAFNDHCFECHATQDGVAIAGPSLFSAGDKFSYAYVRESILDPHAIVVYVNNPQFVEIEMPKEIAAALSENELEDIIAYLLSQIANAGTAIEN